MKIIISDQEFHHLKLISGAMVLQLIAGVAVTAYRKQGNVSQRSATASLQALAEKLTELDQIKVDFTNILARWNSFYQLGEVWEDFVKSLGVDYIGIEERSSTMRLHTDSEILDLVLEILDNRRIHAIRIDDSGIGDC